MSWLGLGEFGSAEVAKKIACTRPNWWQKRKKKKKEKTNFKSQLS